MTKSEQLQSSGIELILPLRPMHVTDITAVTVIQPITGDNVN